MMAKNTNVKFENTHLKSVLKSASSTRSAISAAGEIKKIYILRNNDARFRPQTYLFRVKMIRNNWEKVFDELEKLVPPVHGGPVAHLYTVDGNEVTRLDKIQAGEHYVAAGTDGYHSIRGGYEAIVQAFHEEEETLQGKRRFSLRSATYKDPIYRRLDQIKPPNLFIHVFRNGNGLKSTRFLLTQHQLTKGLPWLLEEIGKRYAIDAKKLVTMDGTAISTTDDLISKGSYVTVAFGEQFRDAWYYLPDGALDTSADSLDMKNAGQTPRQQKKGHQALNPKPHGNGLRPQTSKNSRRQSLNDPVNDVSTNNSPRDSPPPPPSNHQSRPLSQNGSIVENDFRPPSRQETPHDNANRISERPIERLTINNNHMSAYPDVVNSDDYAPVPERTLPPISSSQSVVQSNSAPPEPAGNRPRSSSSDSFRRRVPPNGFENGNDYYNPYYSPTFPPESHRVHFYPLDLPTQQLPRFGRYDSAMFHPMGLYGDGMRPIRSLPPTNFYANYDKFYKNIPWNFGMPAAYLYMDSNPVLDELAGNSNFQNAASDPQKTHQARQFYYAPRPPWATEFDKFPSKAAEDLKQMGTDHKNERHESGNNQIQPEELVNENAKLDAVDSYENIIDRATELGNRLEQEIDTNSPPNDVHQQIDASSFGNSNLAPYLVVRPNRPEPIAIPQSRILTDPTVRVGFF